MKKISKNVHENDENVIGNLPNLESNSEVVNISDNNQVGTQNITKMYRHLIAKTKHTEINTSGVFEDDFLTKMDVVLKTRFKRPSSKSRRSKQARKSKKICNRINRFKLSENSTNKRSKEGRSKTLLKKALDNNNNNNNSTSNLLNDTLVVSNKRDSPERPLFDVNEFSRTIDRELSNTLQELGGDDINTSAKYFEDASMIVQFGGQIYAARVDRLFSEVLEARSKLHNYDKVEKNDDLAADKNESSINDDDDDDDSEANENDDDQDDDDGNSEKTLNDSNPTTSESDMTPEQRYEMIKEAIRRVNEHNKVGKKFSEDEEEEEEELEERPFLDPLFINYLNYDIRDSRSSPVDIMISQSFSKLLDPNLHKCQRKQPDETKPPCTIAMLFGTEKIPYMHLEKLFESTDDPAKKERDYVRRMEKRWDNGRPKSPRLLIDPDNMFALSTDVSKPLPAPSLTKSNKNLDVTFNIPDEIHSTSAAAATAASQDISADLNQSMVSLHERSVQMLNELIHVDDFNDENLFDQPLKLNMDIHQKLRKPRKTASYSDDVDYFNQTKIITRNPLSKKIRKNSSDVIITNQNNDDKRQNKRDKNLQKEFFNEIKDLGLANKHSLIYLVDKSPFLKMVSSEDLNRDILLNIDLRTFRFDRNMCIDDVGQLTTTDQYINKLLSDLSNDDDDDEVAQKYRQLFDKQLNYELKLPNLNNYRNDDDDDLSSCSSLSSTDAIDFEDYLFKSDLSSSENEDDPLENDDIISFAHKEVMSATRKMLNEIPNKGLSSSNLSNVTSPLMNVSLAEPQNNSTLIAMSADGNTTLLDAALAIARQFNPKEPGNKTMIKNIKSRIRDLCLRSVAQRCYRWESGNDNQNTNISINPTFLIGEGQKNVNMRSFKLNIEEILRREELKGTVEMTASSLYKKVLLIMDNDEEEKSRVTVQSFLSALMIIACNKVNLNITNLPNLSSNEANRSDCDFYDDLLIKFERMDHSEN